ncbi:hypothetical protein Tco_1452887 [Tanacetum coccineum]
MSGCRLESVTGLRNQIFRALTASADVPSSVTETTDTTFGRKLKIRNLECIISGRLRDIGYQLIKRSE